jgi:hypothetical protein
LRLFLFLCQVFKHVLNAFFVKNLSFLLLLQLTPCCTRNIRLNLQLFCVELLHCALGPADSHLLLRWVSEAVRLAHHRLLLLLLIMLRLGRSLLLPTETFYLPLDLVRHEMLWGQRCEVVDRLLIRLGAHESLAILQALWRWRLKRLGPLSDNVVMMREILNHFLIIPASVHVWFDLRLEGQLAL